MPTEPPTGLWVREDGSVMLPMNHRRASIRERMYVIALGWRACHNVRLTLFMIRQYLRPSAQVCDYEKWTSVPTDEETYGEQEEDEDGNLIRVPKPPTKEASSVVASAVTSPMDTPS